MPDPATPPDPYADKMRRLEDILLRGPGKLDAASRAALAAGDATPEPLDAYAEKVRRYAYRVTDEDIAALKAAGYTEDQILEATLALAFGAARTRLVKGLAALHGADDATPAANTPDVGEGAASQGAADDVDGAGNVGDADGANANTTSAEVGDNTNAALASTGKEQD